MDGCQGGQLPCLHDTLRGTASQGVPSSQGMRCRPPSLCSPPSPLLQGLFSLLTCDPALPLVSTASSSLLLVPNLCHTHQPTAQPPSQEPLVPQHWPCLMPEPYFLYPPIQPHSTTSIINSHIHLPWAVGCSPTHRHPTRLRVMKTGTIAVCSALDPQHPEQIRFS